MGFGSRWRSWVRNCLRSASISILINGSPSKPFKMGRGLRQGDPLSPFLFTIIAEVLSRMLQKASSLGLIRGLSVGKQNVYVSHLQFADDTLIFSEAEDHYIIMIQQILIGFQALSGLAVNYKKSGLIVIGKEASWAQGMANVIGCLLVELPVRYLGIPLGANMRKAQSWQCIIERVRKKLDSWKSSCLSRAGRVVLIKAVLNSLPLYYMSLFRMPKKVASEINRLQRRFLWSGSKEGKFNPLVRWDTVQASKSRGGLGVGDLTLKNESLLFKWWWRYANEETALWRTVVQSIHNEDQAALPSWVTSRGTGPWKDIKKLVLKQQPSSNMFTKHLKMKLGDGSKIRFWEDPWLPTGTLKDTFPLLYRISNQ